MFKIKIGKWQIGRRKAATIEDGDGRNAIARILQLNANFGEELKPDLPTIDVKGYTKRFRKFVAAKDITFSVGHGVIHGFIGPNGAGKTTTIKAMIGAYIPTSGKIFINGHKAGSVAANRLIGYIPERASFPPHLNTVQYLVAMGQLSGLKARDARQKAVGILSAFGLEKHATRKPIEFSSGMQKKILLAQSLLTNPKILILDEPAANLDPTARKELFDQLIMLRDQGKTILISSHILAELERIIDEVTFLYYGDVIYSGRVDAFLNSVADVFIKATDNELLASLLVAKGYRVSGDLKTELKLENISRQEAQKVFNALSGQNFKILSYRSNDLQSVYDRLIEESIVARRGNQAYEGERVTALNETSEAVISQPLSGSKVGAKTKPATKAKTGTTKTANAPVAPQQVANRAQTRLDDLMTYSITARPFVRAYRNFKARRAARKPKTH